MKLIFVSLEGVEDLLDFYVFNVTYFNVFFGQPCSTLLSQGSTKESLDIRIGREEYSVPFVHAINSIAKKPQDLDPLDKARMATLNEMAQPNYEEDSKFFVEEESDC